LDRRRHFEAVRNRLYLVEVGATERAHDLDITGLDDRVLGEEAVNPARER
jgi:hypothetical protein